MPDISKYIKNYTLISPEILNYKTEGIFCAEADSSEIHSEFGISNGDLLFFDSTEPYEKDKISCFINEETNQLKISKHDINTSIQAKLMCLKKLRIILVVPKEIKKSSIQYLMIFPLHGLKHEAEI